MTDRTGLNIATGAEACKSSLEKFKAKRIAIITPYQEIGDRNVVKFFTEIGCEVVRIAGLKCGSATDIAHVPEVGVVVESGRGWMCLGASSLLGVDYGVVHFLWAAGHPPEEVPLSARISTACRCGGAGSGHGADFGGPDPIRQGPPLSARCPKSATGKRNIVHPRAMCVRSNFQLIGPAIGKPHRGHPIEITLSPPPVPQPRGELLISATGGGPR